jgi:hypothetical protein
MSYAFDEERFNERMEAAQRSFQDTIKMAFEAGWIARSRYPDNLEDNLPEEMEAFYRQYHYWLTTGRKDRIEGRRN